MSRRRRSTLDAAIAHGLMLVTEASTLGWTAALVSLPSSDYTRAAVAVAGASFSAALATTSSKLSTASPSGVLLTMLVCAMVLVAVSPILGSLTRPYSDDTVFALACMCGAVRLYARVVADRGTFSVPAAAAAFLYSLLLASRLADTSSIARFLVGSAFAFAAMHPCFLALRDANKMFYCVVVAAYASSAAIALWPSRGAAAALIASCAILGLALPAWLASMQRSSKRRIPRGPWEPLRVERED